MDIDGAAHVALEARIEQALGVIERGALGEGEFDVGLVGFAGADDAGMRPDRGTTPFPFLENFGNGLVDQRADTGEGFSAPVAEIGDAGIDQARRIGLGVFTGLRRFFS